MGQPQKNVWSTGVIDMQGPVPTGNVVKDFYVGNTHIRICDDYCRDKTPCEVEAILERIAKIAMANFRAAAERQTE